MFEKFNRKIARKGPIRSILEGVLICLLFVAVRHAFNLLLLPALFPEAVDASAAAASTAANTLATTTTAHSTTSISNFYIGSLAAVLLGLAFWLGFPYFAVFTLIGLMLSRISGLHFTLLEGASFPSLMANVLTTASQGGGFLIGAVIEYALLFSRKMSALRGKNSSPPDTGDELLDDEIENR